MMEELYAAYRSSTGVSTDSRKISSRNLFIALKGPSFNGNDYINQVLDGGASYAIVDENRDEFKNDPRILLVEDGLQALQELARFHRKRLKIPVIGLTGSNGKTTSKELLHAALSQHYSTYATKGNLNNHIGVPLSILEITEHHEIAIIEMGANHQKEIEFLCTISKPDHGYITNIGLAHLEGFGGEEGVFIGKKELFDHLRAVDGRLFINLDDSKVVRASEGDNGTSYGQSIEADYQGGWQIQDNLLHVDWWTKNDPTKRSISTQLSGSYNFSNVMSAVAVSRHFGVPEYKINDGLAAYRPSNNRSQVERTKRNNTVIVDCYNANPSSMRAAIENLSKHAQAQKIAIVGDMYELGDQSEVKHQETLKQLIDLNIPSYAIGKYFEEARIDSDLITYISTTDEALKHFTAHPIKDALLLLKGSRTMKLERLLELL